MTLDDLLALPPLERLPKLGTLSEHERQAITAEMAERQRESRRSDRGPVYRYRPSVEEGPCIDLADD